MNRSDFKNSYLSLFIELLAITFIGLVLTLIYNDTIILDELEHLRASYFVSLGEIPYRDFFEHHHPLIWFMFAPIMALLPHSNLIALYTAKSLAFTFSVGSSIIIYLMVKRFMGGIFAAVASLVIYFFYFATWYSFSIFKPDTFMRFFYLCGLYNFLLYYEQRKIKNIVFAALSFATAFIFLQTAAFSIIPLIFPIGYMLYRQPKLWTDFAKASFIFTIVIGGFYGFLYYIGALEQYWQQNFIYNAYLFDIVHPVAKSSVPQFLLIIISAYASMVFVYTAHKQTPYFNIFAILLIGETINHLYFPAVYPHYLVLLFLFCGIVIAFILNTEQNKWLFRLTISGLIINLCMNFFVLTVTNNSRSHIYLYEYDKNPDAVTINFDVTLFNIFAPKLSYYWFYPNFEFIDNAIFNRLPDYDINKLISANQPEYIAYDASIKQAFDFRNIRQKYDIKDCYNQHLLDTKLLQNYDEILPNLFRRKP